jgi:hypothetical protein
VRQLAKQAGIRPSTVDVAPGAQAIVELVGPPAPFVEPPPVVEQAPRQAAGPRGGRGRNGGPKQSAAPKRSNPNGPARTRKELEARAGQQPARRRSR